MIAPSKSKPQNTWAGQPPPLEPEQIFDPCSFRNLIPFCFVCRAQNSEQAGQTGQAAWIGYLAWGDDQGRVHLMREDDLIAERTRPGQGLVAVVDEKLLRKHGDGQRNFVISVAPGEWIAKIEFVPDLALTGMLVIASSDGVVHVFDIETRERVGATSTPCP